MINIVGNSLLIFAIINFVSLIFVKYTTARIYIFWLSNVAIFFSFLLLVFAFINSDFSVKNVFLNSSTLKPLIYKIAGSWASHEGSILLYTTLLATLSSFYIKISNYPSGSKNLQITILAFIQILFLSFVYFTSNPFDSFKFTPTQGLGLNPVLQDKALSIHPPLLYIGYVTYIATYVNGLLLLLKPKNPVAIIQNNLFFSSFALMTLTAGIGLGSWWAYRELGWGGYWFFDPVENISLMPWLLGIALHHFLLVSNKSGKYINWSIILSISTFLLTIYGVFFVRSGIITSVHSFAFSKERGLYLFGICFVLTMLPVFMQLKVANRSMITNRPRRISKEFFRNLIILSGNILWILAFISLFIALIYPIYYSYIYNIDSAIDPKYFQTIFLPIFTPIMVLASLVSFYFNIRNLAYVLFSIFIVSIFYYYIKTIGIISGSILFASIFLMIQIIDFALVETNFFKNSISSKKLSLIIGHFSLGLLAFSITCNVLLSKEIEFIGKVGDVVSNDLLSVKLNNIKFSDSKVYYSQIAEFSIKDDKNNIVILKPENRLYKIENALSQESDIYSYITHDIFAVLSKIDGEIIHAMIYYRPMIYFIWFSVFLISVTFFIYICGRSKFLSQTLDYSK